ncbi:hypothetical protein KKH96_02495 [Patescibacteria group bacterium]|nr:hypothetical protein [Patescibacteria group bacterium]
MKKVFLIILIIIVGWFALRFIIGGSEDTWICDKEKGEWVKHGVPSAPMPIEPCGEVVCKNYENVESCPEKCVVCPPCIECSSISCQTEGFCESIGFDKDWYKNIKENIPLIFNKEIHSIASNSKECSMAGVLTDNYFYNENSKTWWIDLERMSELENDGCNPACVVSEETKTAEVNWRCTGLSTVIKNLFIKKYPKYASTISIDILHEAKNHVRGNVIFQQGAEGGYFLAAKIGEEWQIILDGNGQISCDLLEEYGFPEEMLFDCS